MKNKLIALLLLCAVKLQADPVTIQITLSDAQQAAYARVQTRETDTNLVSLKLPDYVVALLMQSVTGVTKQERNADVQMLAEKLKAADSTTQEAVKNVLSVKAEDVIPADAPSK